MRWKVFKAENNCLLCVYALMVFNVCQNLITYTTIFLNIFSTVADQDYDPEADPEVDPDVSLFS